MEDEVRNYAPDYGKYGISKDRYYYTFDFSTFPWRVDFVPRPSSVVSEFRLNRNITDCSVTLDDDDLCTRFYQRQRDTGKAALRGRRARHGPPRLHGTRQSDTVSADRAGRENT